MEGRGGASPGLFSRTHRHGLRTKLVAKLVGLVDHVDHVGEVAHDVDVLEKGGVGDAVGAAVGDAVGAAVGDAVDAAGAGAGGGAARPVAVAVAADGAVEGSLQPRADEDARRRGKWRRVRRR